MPKFTNRLNLPEALVKAVTNDGYSAGNSDYSVTTLLKPPRLVVLERQHRDEIEEDVSDRMWALLGQLMHGVLERAAMEGEVEQRHTVEILGKKISGAIDIYLDGVIQDYKLMSVWKVTKGVPREFEEQLNCYAYLLRSKGKPVRDLQLVCVLRDWSKLETLRNDNYPKNQVVLLDVPLWDEETQRIFIEGRIQLHMDALINLPLCTPEERWATPEKYAVTKKGQKKALKLHDSLEDAIAHSENVDDSSVSHRPGESKRCGNYCPAAKFCDQWKKIQEQERKK